jgi:dienelactone hydrolase
MGKLALVFALLVSSLAHAEVKVIEVASPFPSSMLYVPNDGKPHPGVIFLHGSEGGSLPYMNLEAQLLAAHGFATLAFCWYNCLKDPITMPIDTLENVELGNTIKALQWLKDSKYVGGRKVALAGWSRGAEQAVLLGSLPEAAALADAVAVHTPADTVINGFSWATYDQRCWICSGLDLACFKGSPDPEQWDYANMKWNPSCGAQPKDYDKTIAWLLHGKALTVGQPIEIEKFGKPVFLTVGDKDNLWDWQQTVRLKDRLEKAGKPVELHVFPGEHHIFQPANENERHRLEIEFLQKTLGE